MELPLTVTLSKHLCFFSLASACTRSQTAELRQQRSLFTRFLLQYSAGDKTEMRDTSDKGVGSYCGESGIDKNEVLNAELH